MKKHECAKVSFSNNLRPLQESVLADPIAICWYWYIFEARVEHDF